jgi:hypothetical protein
MAKESSGVGRRPEKRQVLMPLAAKISAAASANSAE